jgi:hypothetical protein
MQDELQGPDLPAVETEGVGRVGRFRGASMSRRWIVIIAVLALDLIIAIAVVAILLDRERDEARRAAAIAATSTTGVSSPYDFTELPDEVDLDVIEDASFVSILVPNETGELTSYGVSMDLPAAKALADAVRDADEVDAETAASVLENGAMSEGAPSTDPAGAGTTGTDSTGARVADAALTFVLPGRETLTFLMDLDQGLIAREGRAWQVDGDLRALVLAATASPG